MTKEAYPALFHYIHRAMAEVNFPTTKREILEKAGNVPVHTDWEISVPLKTFVEPIPQESFSCAADFYCKLIAAM